MKKAEIRVGGLYSARISGRYVTVRVDKIRQGASWNRDCTMYDVTNLTTGRKTTFKSAAKFRSEVKAKITKNVEMTPDGGVPLPKITVEETMPDGSPVPSRDELEELVPEAFRSEGENSADPTNASTAEQYQDISPAQTAVETQEAPAQSAEPNTAQVVTSLAAKIAATAAEPTTNLTQQQQDILATAKEIESARDNGQRVMVIAAGAGTGKTFTLKQLEQVLYGNGQYTAFNKSLVSDSKSKFKRAACNTSHALAFREVGKQFAHRLNGPRVKSYQIAAILGIEDYYVELPESLHPYDDGKPQTRRLKSSFLAGQVTEAIRKFCQSADPEITTKHFTYIDGIDEARRYKNNDKVKNYLLPFAQKAWADLSITTGTLPFSHDVYVKLWEMGRGPNRPVIAADYILLDEAQDTAPVMLSILQQQTHATLILVGDDNQQIYEWRGAVNAMASFPNAPRRLLSQSFRFGQTVADVANSILATLEEPTDLVMSGLESIPSRICPVAEPRCYLYRTNAGAIGRLMAGMAENKRGHLIGGTKEMIAFCRAALDLQAKNGTNHQELGCFANWTEVQEYSKEAEGADLRLNVKLIDDFGADRIINALNDMPTEDRADFVACTAHKSKGREWESVRLGQDFPTANKLTDADRRLIYVACTRAQEELDLTQCPTFCGGYDKKGGGEDGEGGAEWIPGITINYTVPMPTKEELAEYRANKSATEVVISSKETQPDPVPESMATAAVAQTNGDPATTVEFSWANMDGQWLVRGPADQPIGDRVTVKRKNNTSSQETLRGVVRKIGDLWFYSIR